MRKIKTFIGPVAMIQSRLERWVDIKPMTNILEAKLELDGSNSMLVVIYED